MRWIALSILLMACGGGTDATGAGSGGGGNAGGGNGGSGNSGGASNKLTVTIGPIAVASGEERTQCVVKKLGNAQDVQIGRMDNSISSSSHHMIVYKTNEPEQPDPFDCDPFTDTLNPDKGAPLMITQKHEDFLELPSGVAYSLPAGQNIRLELHYINTTASKVNVNASSTFTVLPDASVQNSADLLFIGTIDISLPANTETKVGPLFFKMPSDFDQPNFFAITGHTHSLGKNVSVDAVQDASDPGTPVYDVPGWLWDEPETVVHDPPFQVPADGGFRFTCDYQNTSTSTVTFGESAKKEMCFFWTYYYPSQGAKVCIHTKQLGGQDACCPGNSLMCSYFGLWRRSGAIAAPRDDAYYAPGEEQNVTEPVVPTVDLEAIEDSDPGVSSQAAAAIREGFGTYGLIYVRNHGVDIALLEPFVRCVSPVHRSTGERETQTLSWRHLVSTRLDPSEHRAGGGVERPTRLQGMLLCGADRVAHRDEAPVSGDPRGQRVAGAIGGLPGAVSGGGAPVASRRKARPRWRS